MNVNYLRQTPLLGRCRARFLKRAVFDCALIANRSLNP